jgi:septum formation protein
MRAPVLLLASNSPRRRQLLALGEWEFKVYPANIDENHQPGETPAQYVLRLAETKARTAASEAQAGWLVVAADTIVVDHTPHEGRGPSGAEILEKPASQAEAFRMLAQLRGRTHQVFTALAVYDPTTERLLTDLCITDVPMRAYTDGEIAAYIASGDPMDKAGAYAIQNAPFHPVDHLRGCYASVMGLPLCHLQRTLRRFGVVPTVNLPQACQEAIQYNCPVFGEILEDRES